MSTAGNPTPENDNKRERPEECVICLEELTEADHPFRCGHVICTDCKMLKRLKNNTCPVCEASTVLPEPPPREPVKEEVKVEPAPAMQHNAPPLPAASTAAQPPNPAQPLAKPDEAAYVSSYFNSLGGGRHKGLTRTRLLIVCGIYERFRLTRDLNAAREQIKAALSHKFALFTARAGNISSIGFTAIALFNQCPNAPYFYLALFD